MYYGSVLFACVAEKLSYILKYIERHLPTSLAAWSEEWVCARSLAGLACLNAARVMDVSCDVV